MKAIVNGVGIECVRGDIAFQEDVTAVVNAANAELMPGEGWRGRYTGPQVPDSKRNADR